MALATQCPHCSTIFRVANDQLKLHSGVVRCGACHQTFNGVEHLLPPSKIPAHIQSVHITPKAKSLEEQQASAPAPTPTAAIKEVSEPTSTAVAHESPAEKEEAAIPSESPSTSETTNEYNSAFREEPAPVADLAQEERSTIKEAIVEVSKTPSLSDSLDFDMGDEFAPEEESNHVASSFPQLIDDESGANAETLVTDESAETDSNEDEAAEIASHETSEAESDHEHIAEQSLDHAATDREQSELDEHIDPTGDEVDTANVEESPEEAEEAEHDKPSFVLQAERKQGIGKKIRGAMIALLIILIPASIGQATYAFRNQIAAWIPQTKPALVSACQLLRCQIRFPQQIEQITIESSELQTLTNKKNNFLVSVQIQNKSSIVQAWPMLELTLSDAKDKPVLVRSFTPTEYLSDKGDLARGFAPSTEQSIKLYFELTDIKASTYRLAVYYP